MPNIDVFPIVALVISIILLWILSFFRWWKFCSHLEFPIHIFLIYGLFFRDNPLGASSLAFLAGASVLFWFILKWKWFKHSELVIPLGLLALSRFLPHIEMSDIAMVFGGHAPAAVASTGLMSQRGFVGLSYFTFRWMRLGFDVKKAQSAPGLFIFLTYCFYMPIFFSGPIASFERFSASYKITLERSKQVLLAASLRILWGSTKFYVLSALFFQVTLTRQVMDRVSLSIPELVLGLAAYPAYLFLNFSGFTDIVIGGSAILGYEIDDNFDRPYLATNLRSFWRKWHMSLTRLLGDAIYLPLVKFLKDMGASQRLATYIPGTIFIFGIMAAWHGISWNFFAFSALQAVGLIAEEVFRELKPSFYLKNQWLSRMILWSFLATSFFFFENNPEQISKILLMLRMAS